MDVVHLLHELLPQDEDPEDSEEVQGMSGVEDNYVVCRCKTIKDPVCSS
jgi:hypothetical protein